MAEFTVRDGLRAFYKGFVVGVLAGIAYQLVKNPGACSCCGCVLAILAVIAVIALTVVVITWWTWISVVVVLVVVAKVLADYLEERSRSDAADADR